MRPAKRDILKNSEPHSQAIAATSTVVGIFPRNRQAKMHSA